MNTLFREGILLQKVCLQPQAIIDKQKALSTVSSQNEKIHAMSDRGFFKMLFDT